MLMNAIRASWSADTTDDWNPDEPSNHQCGVTTLVVQDYLGGVITRNVFGTLTVYFNVLPDGTEVFFDPQYAGMARVHAADETQSREQVMRHHRMSERYPVLRGRVAAQLGNG